jgi:hypothetical protein
VVAVVGHQIALLLALAEILFMAVVAVVAQRHLLEAWALEEHLFLAGLVGMAPRLRLLVALGLRPAAGVVDLKAQIPALAQMAVLL